MCEINLLWYAATIDLDLHQVGLFLLERGLADLGVGEKTNNSAVFLDTLEFASDGSSLVLGVSLGVFGESLLLALVPILIEPSLHLIAQVLSPDCGKRAEPTGSLNVTNETDSNHLENKRQELI
jgi:hypothetical protein